MIKLPGDNGWFQSNRSDVLGSISQSFNLDLASNLGRVRTTRAKRLAYTGSPTNFGQVVGIERFLADFYVGAESAAGDDIWSGGNSPYDSIALDGSSVEVIPARTDMHTWNSALVVTASTEIFYSTNGTGWTEVGSNVLTGNGGLLTSMNDTLYVSDEHYKVKNVNASWTFAGTGAQTLNLALPGYTIMVLMAGIDSIWVGLSNRDGSGNSLVFEWDGETENTPTARYEINASGLMAGVVKDGVPYIVDSRGRLLTFTGGVFQEIDRFPINGGTFRGFNDTGYGSRAIHPRGMAVDGDEILINVANATDGLTTSDFNEFPSGVWAYSERTGLYHKYSPSYQAKADTGTTNLTDHGQVRCASAGPMMVYEAVDDGTTDNAGRVVFAMEYYTDDTTTEYGLFADDTNDTTQKAGWCIFPKLGSANFRDTWQAIYAALSDLETSGDLVEVKYRTKDHTAIYVPITWHSTSNFGSDTDLSDYEQGDEVTIIQGPGAGAVAHITEIQGGNNSGVTLDRALTGIVADDVSVARLDKWKKVGEIEDIAHEGFQVGEDGHWIQVKIYMQWTGKRELYGILITNKSSIS